MCSAKKSLILISAASLLFNSSDPCEYFFSFSTYLNPLADNEKIDPEKEMADLITGGNVDKSSFKKSVKYSADGSITMNDLQNVTQIAYKIVTYYGMNNKVGLVSFYSEQESFQKPYSEETASMIDEEVRILVKKAYTKARHILIDKKDLLTKLAEELLKKEVLFKDEVEQILGVKCASVLA